LVAAVTQRKVIDLFAGPGGWSEALRQLGIPELGIELDEAACATRHAAGHGTLRADVAALDPARFDCETLIASPPCQAWSMAGKRGGERDRKLVYDCALELAVGNDVRELYRERCEDQRSILAVEPLRWALAIRPARMAWEQVPPVLDFWRFCARLLREQGYRVWTGILSAERYGVPQTRKRAILMASLDGPVHPPAPTHQAYVPGERAEEQHTLEGTLAPWVSMAEALGWGVTESPSPVVMTARNRQTGHDVLRGSSWRMEQFRKAQERGEWHYRNGNQPNAARRPLDEPAPKLPFGHALNSGVEWTTTPDAPWASERPATTVNTTNGIAKPGHHGEQPMSTDAIRVSLEDALVLQGFRPDYPVQGGKTKQFEQVGNAVPPPLARAIVSELVGAQLEAAV
jgi:DNA (cytosine-5)-methyltransferase 1